MSKSVPDAFVESQIRGFKESKVRARVSNGGRPIIYVVVASVKKHGGPFGPPFTQSPAWTGNYGPLTYDAQAEGIRRFYQRQVIYSFESGGVLNTAARNESFNHAGLNPTIGGQDFTLAPYTGAEYSYFDATGLPADDWDAKTASNAHGAQHNTNPPFELTREITDTRADEFDSGAAMVAAKARVRSEDFSTLWALHKSRDIFYDEFSGNTQPGDRGIGGGSYGLFFGPHDPPRSVAFDQDPFSSGLNGVDQLAPYGFSYDGHEIANYYPYTGAQYDGITAVAYWALGAGGPANPAFPSTIGPSDILVSRVQIRPFLQNIDFCVLEFGVYDEDGNLPIKILADYLHLDNGGIYELPEPSAPGSGMSTASGKKIMRCSSKVVIYVGRTPQAVITEVPLAPLGKVPYFVSGW